MKILCAEGLFHFSHWPIASLTVSKCSFGEGHLVNDKGGDA